LQHTVLIVDNEADNLRFLKALLEGKGYVVHQAPSARFAASLVRRNIGRYSLALIDYHMPEIMGDEATRLLHGIDRDLQVITISGDDSEEAFDTNLRAGSYLVLNRTISSSRLLSIVHN